jgi:hypothetical protein
MPRDTRTTTDDGVPVFRFVPFPGRTRAPPQSVIQSLLRAWNLLVSLPCREGCVARSAIGVLVQPAAPAGFFRAAKDDTMTTTDIGILLIVLCILLWAIMAALHRHTVQMKALQAQLDELLDAQRARSFRTTETGTPGRGDLDEPRVLHAAQGEKRA